jgi:hypothetical protein
MTAEEWWERGNQYYLDDPECVGASKRAWTRVIQEAVAEERNRCLRLIQQAVDSWKGYGTPDVIAARAELEALSVAIKGELNGLP